VFPLIAAYLIHQALELTEKRWAAYLRNLQLPVIGSAAIMAGMAPGLFLITSAPVRLIVCVLCAGAAFLTVMLFSADGRAMLPNQLLRFWDVERLRFRYR
jgi:hypothetical protein